MNSWHYRLLTGKHLGVVTFLDDRQVSTNLCLYFWQVVFGLMYMLIVVPITICILMMIFIIGPIFVGIGEFSGIGSNSNSNTLLTDVLGYMGIYLYAIIGIIFACVGVGSMAEWLLGKSKSKSKGLVSSYFRAKKDRVCPTLEIED